MNITDFLAKITGQADRLDAAISKLEADHKAVIDAKDEEIANLRSSLESAPKPEDLTAKETEISALRNRAEKAEADLGKLPEIVNAKVAEVIAANGHAPVDTVANEEVGAKELSREQFNALTPAKRMTFIKSGGKLTD